MEKIKKVLQLIIIWLIIISITFGFLSLCNLSINIKDWNGFSRFILGCEGIFFLLNIMYEV